MIGAPPPGYNSHFWLITRGTYLAASVDGVYIQRDMRSADPALNAAANVWGRLRAQRNSRRFQKLSLEQLVNENGFTFRRRRHDATLADQCMNTTWKFVCRASQLHSRHTPHAHE